MWQVPVQAVRRGWARSLAQLPSQCALCRAWPARRLCDACIARWGQPQPRCATCALPLAGDAPLCGACLREPPLLARCIAAVDYAYPWAGVLAAFKFQGDPGWAGPLAALLRSTPWAEPMLEAADMLVPVPLSAERLAERGFNQAQRLALHLHAGKTDARLLLRLRSTADQHTLSRADRLRNLRGAFGVDPLRMGDVQGRRLLLVDDVMTTGATLHAAAAALRAAGAAEVGALVVARTERG